MTGNRIGRQLSLATRRELIEAIADRYHSGTRIEKQKILDEFIEVTGFHRKHAIRVLRKIEVKVEPKKRSRTGLYNEAAMAALTILWEASDRICGKRLKEAIPTLVVAMEQHGHLQLDTEVRQRLLAMSAASSGNHACKVRACRLQIESAGLDARARSQVWHHVIPLAETVEREPLQKRLQMLMFVTLFEIAVPTPASARDVTDPQDNIVRRFKSSLSHCGLIKS